MTFKGSFQPKLFVCLQFYGSIIGAFNVCDCLRKAERGERVEHIMKVFIPCCLFSVSDLFLAHFLSPARISIGSL